MTALALALALLMGYQPPQPVPPAPVASWKSVVVATASPAVVSTTPTPATVVSPPEPATPIAVHDGAPPLAVAPEVAPSPYDLDGSGKVDSPAEYEAVNEATRAVANDPATEDRYVEFLCAHVDGDPTVMAEVCG